MNAWTSFWSAMRAYVANDDPLVETGNFVAMIVAWNQPFYPLYVYWSAGTVEPSFYTFLSTPFFLAVPAVARRWPVAGRILLVLAGIGNTMVSAKAFGVASGVEAFFLPCVTLAFLLFGPSQRWISYGLAGLAFLAYFALHGRYGAPAHLYSAAEYSALFTLNFLSVFTLTALLGILASGLIAKKSHSAPTR